MKLYILLVLFVLISCDGKSTSNTSVVEQDTFYTSSSTDFDLIRFPLIKPFEVISIDDGAEWMVNSNIEPKNIADINDISNIEEIANIDSSFFIYSKGNTIVGGQQFPEAWYIIHAKDSVVKGFTEELSFLKYLKEKNIENLSWKSPQALFKQFDRTYNLPWLSMK